jgi:hypothetical protein
VSGYYQITDSPETGKPLLELYGISAPYKFDGEWHLAFTKTGLKIGATVYNKN